ncbi:MAG: PH domain-containing protein [Nitrososphaeraceae archaeon]|nr:PH domain-containing protein [Nitrososphaeraceae archaeon]
MVFGFDEVKEGKDGNSHYLNKKILDKDDLDEINKISEMLNQDEKVLIVARQSKLKPGGSYFTPNTIYATDRRIIIRDPYMLGIKSNVVDIPYDVITSLKLEKGLLSSTIKLSTRINEFN